MASTLTPMQFLQSWNFSSTNLNGFLNFSVQNSSWEWKLWWYIYTHIYIYGGIYILWWYVYIFNLSSNLLSQNLTIYSLIFVILTSIFSLLSMSFSVAALRIFAVVCFIPFPHLSWAYRYYETFSNNLPSSYSVVVMSEVTRTHTWLWYSHTLRLWYSHHFVMVLSHLVLVFFEVCHQV